MDLSNIKKGIFSIKKNAEKDEPKIEIPELGIKTIVNYEEHGFIQAGKQGGSISGLRVNLQKIYFDFRQKVKEDFEKQNELKRPFIVKIEEYKGDIERLSNKIEKTNTESIPRKKSIIEKLKEELSYIKKNPQEITGDDAGKAGFIIGGIILVFLTVYLFIFYSSASYSTFFKEFSLNEIGVASSIFDPKALTIAFQNSITELLLIVTIPFVFLGLGYLIHKFQEQKGFGKYFKIAMLIFITFIFDTILAYEITEKIYDIKKGNSFEKIPDYTLNMAFHSINFWLIIFAGFIVYLIWGFVFSFVMEALAKMDKVKIALEEKNKEIKDAELELKDFDIQIDKMTHTKAESTKEMNKLKRIIENAIIPDEFEHDIFTFSTGWISYMRLGGKSKEEIEEANIVTHEFVKITLHSWEPINAN